MLNRDLATRIRDIRHGIDCSRKVCCKIRWGKSLRATQIGCRGEIRSKIRREIRGEIGRQT